MKPMREDILKCFLQSALENVNGLMETFSEGINCYGEIFSAGSWYQGCIRHLIDETTDKLAANKFELDEEQKEGLRLFAKKFFYNEALVWMNILLFAQSAMQFREFRQRGTGCTITYLKHNEYISGHLF